MIDASNTDSQRSEPHNTKTQSIITIEEITKCVDKCRTTTIFNRDWDEVGTQEVFTHRNSNFSSI